MIKKTILGRIKLYLTTFITEVFRNGHVVKMSAYFNMDGSLHKENWGDDINYWFFNSVSKRPIISYDWSLLTRKTNKHYVIGIGSLLTMFPLKNSIVWGTGILSSTKPFNGIPKEVRAVRGPLTRQRLIDSGIPCPEVYGDPALLLPKFYQPNISKKHLIGIIPHYKDLKNPLITKLSAITDAIIINVRDYDNWLDFINKICECNAIVSSSLHGLIVSEAYNIPNLWIKLPSADQETDDVKFHDFFLSLGHDREVFNINDTINTQMILNELKKYKKGYIDLNPLIEACPLKLNWDTHIN